MTQAIRTLRPGLTGPQINAASNGGATARVPNEGAARRRASTARQGGRREHAAGDRRPAGSRSRLLPRLRGRAWPSPALLLAAWVFAAPAAAQDFVKLVSNTGKTTDGAKGSFANDFAQSFSTGRDGYTLQRVSLNLEADGDQPSFSVKIHAHNSTVPGTELAELGSLGRLSSDAALHYFWTNGVDLAPNTTYWVVIDVSSGNADTKLARTASNDEDTGGAAGWSIGDTRLTRSNSATTWNPPAAESVKMAIHGYIKPRPTIDLVRIVSAPTDDANDDGQRDTYVRGDKILIDVEFSAPVEVTIPTGGSVRLRLDLGTDDNDLTNSRKTVHLDAASGVLHGGMTLRFAYTVATGSNCGTATATGDCDTDGVWVQTTSSNQVLILHGGATITSAETGAEATLTKSGLPTAGEADAKVDGGTTAADTGPRPSSATVNGKTLTVTYNRTLAAVTAADRRALERHFSVRGAGGLHGGHRNAYQHPSAVAVSGSTVTLTLGVGARAGDEVTLTYKLEDHSGPLKGPSGTVAPAFIDLAVTNNTPGNSNPPLPVRASVEGTTLQVVFDGELNGSSAPAGSAFLVETSDLDDDTRDIRGTGTATVSGKQVTVTLAEAVRADESARVSYEKPASNPLQSSAAGNAAVLAFSGFKVAKVSDVTAPRAKSVTFTSTSVTPPRSRVQLFFDEALDTSSVPAGGDFGVTLAGTAATVSDVVVRGHAVAMTIDQRNTDSRASLALSYTVGANPIRDVAGNTVAVFSLGTEGQDLVTAPSTLLANVRGSLLWVFANKRIFDLGSVPAPAAFTLHYPLLAGETQADDHPNRVVEVWFENFHINLRLAHPVYPCDGASPFTVTYTKPTDSPWQTNDGTDVPGFTRSATNTRASDCAESGASANSGPSGNAKTAKSVTLQFPSALDTGREVRAAMFRLAGASGGAAPAVAGAAYTADATGVALALGRALAAGETVAASYERPAGEPGLWEAAGRQIGDFAGVAVTYGGPALRVSDARAAEGGTLAFAVRLDAAAAAEVTVAYATADGTAAAGEDYEAASGTLTFAPGERKQTVEVAALEDLEAEDAETLTLTLSDARGATIADGEATGTVTDGAAAPLTAAFHDVPAEHDGSRLFSFEIRFSEEFEGLKLRALEAGALEVTGGRLVDVKRTTRGENRRVTARVRPASSGDVTVSLAATTDCSAAAAICTRDGRMLSNSPSATVSGPGGAQPGSNSPATGAPTIGGTARVGETLEASTAGIEDADGLTGAAFAYQWLSDDAAIAGATGASYTLAAADEGAAVKVRVTFTDDAGHEETLTSAATEAVAARLAPLTAAFEGMPAEHDGSKFVFRVRFSEDPAVSFRVLRDEAFTVSNGTVRQATRVDGRNDLREIHVKPSGHGAVSVTLPATTDCDAAGAICTRDGRPLSNSESATVIGPPGLSALDARVEEGAGAVLAFAVTLSRTPSGPVTVEYATADGTAKAGEDYDAASGTLTFAAGETSQTVSVAVRDDEHDEGEETLVLRLSSPSGAWLSDGEATGTIVNRDLMPAALLARFGRATAEQVVEQVEERMAAPRRRGFRARLAGREFQPGRERDFALGFLTQFAPAGAGAASMGGAAPGGAATAVTGSHLAGAFGADTTGTGGALGMGGGAGTLGTAGRQQQPMGGVPGGGLLDSLAPGGDVLSGSGFEWNREQHGGVLSVWNRRSRSSFSGTEGALSLNGDVRTTMFGADWARGPLTVGLSVGHTLGLGGYGGRSAGQMSTSMTGFYPWVGYRLNDRFSVWGVTGFGRGSLSLTPEGQAALETGMSMAMTAVGTRGELLGSRATGGFALAFKADALWVGASSELLDGAAGRLNASEAGATRVRTALEGSRGFTLAGRLSLTPSVEVGLRRDGGDAETGAGLDVGGGFAFADAVLGLSLDVRARMLLAHEAEGFTERGMSLSFGWDRTPSSPLGLRARVAPSWGRTAAGGAEALWSGQMAYGPGSHHLTGSGGQLDAEVGYGLPVGARFVGTPRVGLRSSPYGREYRAGWGLGVLDTSILNLDLGVEAQRRENPTAGGAGNGFLARATVSW